MKALTDILKTKNTIEIENSLMKTALLKKIFILMK